MALQKTWLPKEHMTLSTAAQDLIDSQHVCYLRIWPNRACSNFALPKAENEVMTADSTVECIAEYIAKEIKNQEPSHDIKVIAFEGVGKGAIGYA